MIDEDTRELAADRPLHQCCSDCGVDSARETANDVLAANLLLDCQYRLVDDVGCRPVRCATSDVEQEVLQHLLTTFGVQYLGMPLHAGQPTIGVLEGRDGGPCRGGNHVE